MKGEITVFSDIECERKNYAFLNYNASFSKTYSNFQRKSFYSIVLR